mmetsp:Transcript_11734/g.28438  ORF Transcript_11734/g.28438 Transcript_11734/m.28438 type:complete len:388 (+) Transcript_11734:130-1293(+)
MCVCVCCRAREQVKQLSKDDKASLMQYGAQYCRHVLNAASPSLLTRFFYHFTRHKDGLDYVVMNNCMPPMRAVDELWDLKGCCDDKVVREGGVSVPQVHKRWYMLHWLVAEAVGDCVGILPLGRKRYKAGKTRARTQQFKLEHEDWSEVMRAVKLDVEFLRSSGLCDYSLIIGSLTEEAKANGVMPEFPSGLMGRQPYVIKRGEWWVAYYIGIIDFLQGWTTGKKVAHVIKVGFAPKPISTIQPDDYAKQFLEANQKRFVALPKKVYPEFKVDQSFVFKSPKQVQAAPSAAAMRGMGKIRSSENSDSKKTQEEAIQEALAGLQHLESLRAHNVIRESHNTMVRAGMTQSVTSGMTLVESSIADSNANTEQGMKELESVCEELPTYDC